jgi:hypothetical protein
MSDVRKLSCSVFADLRGSKLTNMSSRYIDNSLVTTIFFDNGASLSFTGYDYIGKVKQQKEEKINIVTA